MNIDKTKSGDGGTGADPGAAMAAEGSFENLLRDVPLELSVELGRVTLSLREVAGRLGPGSIITLGKLTGEKIVFGATVELSDPDVNEHVTYTIVGECEADIKSGFISITAPVARALIGREAGDTVQVRTPRGMREYEIVTVKFQPMPQSPDASTE